MPETNVANTVTILGKTSTVKAATHWKTIAINDPANSAALKINSLFITNNSRNYYVDVDLRIGRLTPQIPGALNRDSIYTSFVNVLTIPIGATVVAISRDNPIWLQPGDFLQIVASRNYWADVVCSYEFVSDQMTNTVQTLNPPSQVMHLNAAQTYGSKGAQLAWTPPFDDGGVEVTNYVVQMRALVNYSPLPEPLNGPAEIWTDWIALHKPVTPVTSLKIPKTVLTDIENDNGGLLSIALESTNLFAGFTVLGWQFRVAAINPVGLGEFSEPSALVQIDEIDALAVTATARLNRVELSWATPTTDPPAGVTYRLVAHNVRWSSDNGMTWRPTPSGQRVDNATLNSGTGLYSTVVPHLQNGVYYTFSVQPVMLKNESTELEKEIVGPWSPPTRNVMPPGDEDGLALEETLQTLFVRWV